MSATNRAATINKLFKVAKKHYSPILPPSNRTVLENMVYACCLENSIDEAADEAFARLQDQYFDWNEVRVTTNVELAEVMKSVYAPGEAATTLKKTLHNVFETYYNFELEFLKKENLRKTVQQMEDFKGVSPFVTSYVAQVALKGHYIPLDQATMNMMVILGIVTEAEAAKGKVPGLERTIPKNKGLEFSSVVHQLAAAFHKTPFSKDLRDVLSSIAADANERFPKRGGRKKKAESPEKPAAKSTGKAVTGKDTTQKTATKKAAPAKKAPAKKAPAKKTPTKKTAAKKSTPKKAAKAKTVKKSSTKKATAKKSIVKKATSGKKKSATKRLARKKPR